MKVNLLQGTCTPTLTPMPGVHNPFHLTAARVRIGTTANGCDRAAAGDRPRYAGHHCCAILGKKNWRTLMASSYVDLALYDHNGRLTAVAEVKNKQGTSREWAAKLRRNL